MTTNNLSPIVVDLTLADTTLLKRTSGGRYAYEFNPDTLVVRQSPATIVYQLTEDTATHYEIVDIVTTDSKDQIDKIEVSGDKRKVTLINRNTARTLIYLTILVKDTRQNDDKLVNCDPQMTNVPPA